MSGTSLDRLAFRTEHWLLSPGGSDMSRLRGYLRLKAWRDCRTLGDRLRALRTAAKFPARVVRDSWRAAGDLGAPVTREHGISRLRQLRQLSWLWLRYGVRPEVYYCFRLYRPGELRRAPNFFQSGEDGGLFRLVNVRTSRAEADLLLDKAAFERWLESHGLPTVRTLVEFADGEIVHSSVVESGLPRCDLFSKPNDLLEGRGAQRWVYADGAWVGTDGPRTEQELIAELREASRGQGLLLQEQLKNHPALAPLAPNALSTVRVLTLRGLDDVVRVVLAVCKIPAGSAPTDHMRLGGVAAPVDLATGRLQRGIRKAPRAFHTPCERHPDTGAVIEGFQLPHWEQVLRVAVAAHDSLPRIVCVGWDVAILERGPVIIEGNDNPGHASSQMPTGIALGETEVVPTLLARLRTSFEAGAADGSGDADPVASRLHPA